MKPDHAELRPVASGGLVAWVRRLAGGGAPRARVTVPTTVRLGETLEVEWRVERLRDASIVTVRLVAAEVARRRQSARTGISTETERRVFFVHEIERRLLGRGATEARGRGAVPVPAGLVPSLAGRLNEIAWAIVVDLAPSEVPSDARQEFSLTVLPVRP